MRAESPVHESPLSRWSLLRIVGETNISSNSYIFPIINVFSFVTSILTSASAVHIKIVSLKTESKTAGNRDGTQHGTKTTETSESLVFGWSAARSRGQTALTPKP